MKPASWEEIPGGRGGFVASAVAVESAGHIVEERVRDTLDAVGFPGATAWNPMTAELKLRDKPFAAQMIGSYDGASWLWSWANDFLKIPEHHTTIARAMRDASARLKIPAFAVPMISDDDEKLPQMMGRLACVHGFGEGYWIANASQVYVFLPGQLAPAIDPDLAAIFFPHSDWSLADVFDVLTHDPRLAKAGAMKIDDKILRISGTGYEVRVRRVANDAELARARGALPNWEQHLAPKHPTAFFIDVSMSSKYTGMRFGSSGRQLPWEALAVCESLNVVEQATVLDVRDNAVYPRE